jgi:hypothetical protein
MAILCWAAKNSLRGTLEHKECTNEIPVTFNTWEVFVDPISLVIKTAAALVRCNDLVPPRWKLGGKWYCSFPELRGLCRAISAASGSC